MMPQSHAPGRELMEALQCIESLSMTSTDTEESDCDLCTTSRTPLTRGAIWGPARTALDAQEEECDYSHHLSALEAANRVDSQYMRRQRPSPGCPPLTPHGRASAVDWMVDASWQLGLSNDALFLGVALLDRYLAAGAAQQAAREQQLLHCVPAAPWASDCDLPQLRDQWRRPARDGGSSGCDGDCGGGGCCGVWQDETSCWAGAQLTVLSAVCLWVAAKYEHSNAPPLELFSRGLLRGSFPTATILETEARLLTAIDYRIASVTTAKTFLRRLMFDLSGVENACGRRVDERLYFLTSYLAEASLLEYGLLAFLPSRVAATSFALAHTLLGHALPSEALVALTGYGPAELAEPMRWLHHVHAALAQAGSLYAVNVKYCSHEMAAAAMIPPILSLADPRVAACAAAGAAATATSTALSGSSSVVTTTGAVVVPAAAAAAAAATHNKRAAQVLGTVATAVAMT